MSERPGWLVTVLVQLDPGGLVTVGRGEHGEAPSQAECVGHRAHHHDPGTSGRPRRAGSSGTLLPARPDLVTVVV